MATAAVSEDRRGSTTSRKKSTSSVKSDKQPLTGLAACFRRPSLVPPYLVGPEQEDVIVSKIRSRILEEIEKDKDSVDQIDIDKLKSRSEMILRFLLEYLEHNKNKKEEEVINKIVGKIIRALKWRKEFGVNEIDPKVVFGKEFCDMTTYYVGKDGRLYYVSRGRYGSRAGDWLAIMMKATVAIMEHYVETFAAKYKRGLVDLHPTVISDVRGVGLHQIDIPVIFRFKNIAIHYPRVITEMWGFGMPWFAHQLTNLFVKSFPKYLAHKFRPVTLDDCIDLMGGIDNVPTDIGGKFEPPPFPMRSNGNKKIWMSSKN